MPSKKKKPVLILYECNTEYLAISTHKDPLAIGKWLLKSIGYAKDYALQQSSSEFDLHIYPVMVTQEELDQYEIEELVVHAELGPDVI